jgi:chromosome segregation ATPase
MALLRLRDDLETLKEEGHALEAEHADLERGRQRYPDGAEALLHLLRARLRGAREPRPLSELIEVPSPRWRDAVEGYLNTRRFDVIVAPEDFPRALGLYERKKRGVKVEQERL